MEKGDLVLIEGQITRLVNRLEIHNGWRVDPPVDDFRFWNEDEMTPLESNKEPPPSQ